MWQEFKEFIATGNVLDMAVGVVMGSAVTNIVNALVEGIIMPIITALTGGASVADLTVSIGSATFNYGSLIQAVIDFLIIAAVLFAIVKSVSKVMPKQESDEAGEEEEVETTDDVLRDIRSLLADQQAANSVIPGPEKDN